MRGSETFTSHGLSMFLPLRTVRHRRVACVLHHPRSPPKPMQCAARVRGSVGLLHCGLPMLVVGRAWAEEREEAGTALGGGNYGSLERPHWGGRRGRLAVHRVWRLGQQHNPPPGKGNAPVTVSICSDHPQALPPPCGITYTSETSQDFSLPQFQRCSRNDADNMHTSGLVFALGSHPC